MRNDPMDINTLYRPFSLLDGGGPGAFNSALASFFGIKDGFAEKMRIAPPAGGRSGRCATANTKYKRGNPMNKINQRRLFIASCIALITTAMTFSIRGDILSAFGTEFNLSHEQQGYINLAGIWGFPIAILITGPLCDALGMGFLLGLACLGHIAGVIATIASPAYGFPMLLASTLVIGFANGTVEAVVNPLTATLYADRKTAKLNVLHAFWPGGLVIGGLLALGLSSYFGLGGSVTQAVLSLSWKVKMATILVAAIIYGVMVIGQKFPLTERAASGVSAGAMFKEAVRPGYLLILFCMILTAITELGPDQWVGSVMSDTVGMRGITFLVYTSALMFLLRFYAGGLAHTLSPFGLLMAASVLSAAGLYLLSHSFTAGAAFAAATVFGIGKAYFWPTMLGVTSERYPRGGSLLMAMTGAIGMMAAGAAGPTMGWVYDTHTMKNLPENVAKVMVVDGKYSPAGREALKTNADKAALKEAEKQGAAMTFRYVSVLPVALIFLFGGLFLYHRSRGGYKAIHILAKPTPIKRR
jgi:MFS family permease